MQSPDDPSKEATLQHPDSAASVKSMLGMCRDNVLGDALDTCQKLLQLQYLDYFAAALRDARTWQAAEAALFALK